MPKRTLRCTPGEQRFTMLRVNGDATDTHAARSFQQALELAQPDRGARVDVFAVCASDAGAARLPGVYRRRGQLLRTFRAKRG